MKPPKIRTIHYGLGMIGAEVARLVLDRSDIEAVAAIDSHPSRAGKDLGEVVGLNRNLGISVAYDPESIFKQVAADIVLHVTDSSLTAAYPQILQAVSAGKHVISTCEEMAFPWTRYSNISQNLDRRARQAGVCILGLGVGLGFMMDALSLLLTTACHQIISLRVARIVEVAPQRLDVCSKLGVGLSLDGFKLGASDGSIGHAGLRESMFMIADTLGWGLESVSETIEPIMAQKLVKTDYFQVDKNYVVGLRQSVSGLVQGREVIRLTVEMSLNAENPRDEITIDGRPPIRVTVPGGVQGDLAAAAVMVNCVPTIARSQAPGLLSLRDMPIAPYRGPGRQTAEEASA